MMFSAFHEEVNMREGAMERLLVVEAALDMGIITYHATTGILSFDEAAAALHGIQHGRACSAPLDHWLSWLLPDDQQVAKTLLTGGVASGITARMTVRLPGPDLKKPRLLELSLRSFGSSGELVGACRDVTRERSAETLRRQKLAAERASHAKSEFMSHISHELRTPLNAILGFAQLMAMDTEHPLPHAHRERLERVQHSGKRLLCLIDQVLQITKIERGKFQLHLKATNVRSVVKHCVDTLELAASARGIDISVDIERPELSSVRADPLALEQIVTNLLSNAIKYNRDAGKVRISYRAGSMGELIVDDTGNGLTEAQLGRMFEPFDRLDADKSMIPGTGLGLVITKQLIEAMAGKLEVRSQLGAGSRFRVRLPLARGSREECSTNLPLGFPPQSRNGVNYSVLYIEDDEVNVVLLEQLFTTQPEWRIECAYTAVDGITAAVRTRPDLILLDMNLPDIPGSEVFRRLQSDQRTRHIPCIAVSADALPARITQMLELGFKDYWTKPLDLTATVEKLKKVLNG
ncbi:MAG: ATP-binding protein [Casimicrobiaceae bacterium]